MKVIWNAEREICFLYNLQGLVIHHIKFSVPTGISSELGDLIMRAVFIPC